MNVRREVYILLHSLPSLPKTTNEAPFASANSLSAGFVMTIILGSALQGYHTTIEPSRMRLGNSLSQPLEIRYVQLENGMQI